MTDLSKLTQIVRAADEQFEREGGGTRHWVRDCFLPGLEAAGLKIVDRDYPFTASPVEALHGEQPRTVPGGNKGLTRG